MILNFYTSRAVEADNVIELRIDQQDAGKKAHRYLRQLLPGMPLSGIYKMLRTGRVKRGGRRVQADDVLAAGDILHLYMADADFARVRKSARKFAGIDARVDVRYEDDDILVVAKPAGLLVHGAGTEHKDTLVNRVAAYLYHTQSASDRVAIDSPSRVFSPAPVHRLDRNTSGLVAFAKTAEAARRLSEDIADHRVRKWYVAIVVGETQDQGVIRARVERNPVQNVTSTAETGKPAETRFVRVASRTGTSLVQIELVSGRTHQIRAHFASIGHPLVGDVKYGAPRSKQDAHQWLHAGALEFPDGRRVTASFPEPFRQRLLELGYAPDEIRRALS